jgi:hypothetical protein
MIVEDIELYIIRNDNNMYNEEKARQWVENGSEMEGPLS